MADDQQPPAGSADDDGPDRTREFPAASGDETVKMPAPDAEQRADPTAVFPSASAWSGQASVPQPDLREPAPTEVWQEPIAGRRGWWLPAGIAVLALALLALVGFGLWLIFKEDGNGSNPGGTVASASSSATASPSRSRATGTPTASKTVPERVVVPRIGGMDAASAQRTLDELGLTYQLTYRASSSAPPNTVIETRPAEGAVVRKGSEVTLVIATAPRSSAPASPSPSPSPTRTD